MYLILMGPPGSGKGTQAKLLIDHFGIDHISTGDMLRATAAADSSMGRMVKEILDEGHLVADELVAQLVDYRLDHDNIASGFVMDGYPRTEVQTHSFDQSMTRRGLVLDAAILLEVNDNIVVSRMNGRRIDPRTGQTYNLSENGDIPREIRDRLQQREDDTDEVMRERLQVYHAQIAPVIEHYQRQNLLVRVDGMAAPDEIFAEIRRQTENIAQRS